MNSSIDMTKGPIMKLIVLFALPICVGNVLQQLYSTVDTLVIGNFCGSVSLAAVGTSSQPVEMLLCIFLGFGTGLSILVSVYRKRGYRKYADCGFYSQFFSLSVCHSCFSIWIISWSSYSETNAGS